jgi:ribosome-binding protein aMBF1 (putative translation factor)
LKRGAPLDQARATTTTVATKSTQHRVARKAGGAMGMKDFTGLLAEARQHLDYWVAGAENAFTEELARAMDEQDVSRTELARRIGTSPAYITKVLRGNANFTLTTMTKLALAVGMQLRVRLEPAEPTPKSGCAS